MTRLFPWIVILLLMGVAGAEPPDPMQTAGRALQLQEAKRYGEAAEVWAQAAREFAQTGNLDSEGRAWFYQAGALFDGGKKEEALVGLVEARRCFESLQSPAGLALVTLQQGIIYRDLERWTEAEAALRESVSHSREAKDEKRALESLEILGSLFEAGRRWPEATAVTLQLVEGYSELDSSKVPQFLSTLGALYQLQNDPTKAEKYYREGIAMLRAQERPGEALEEEYRLARYFLQSRQYDQAVTMLAQLRVAYQGQPRADYLGVDQAYGLMQMGQPVEALALTNKLLARTTNAKIASVLQVRKLELLAELGMEKEALAHIADPNFGSDFQRAQAANRVGRRDLAEQYYRQALEQAPAAEKPNYANSLAIALMRWGRPGEAGEILSEALTWPASQNPSTRATLTLNLGESFLKRGLPKKALPHFEQAAQWFEVNGDYVQAATALNNLGATHEYLGDYPKALTVLEKAVAVGEKFQKPDTIQGTIANATGLLYVKLGRLEDGVRFYRKALAVHQLFDNAEGQIASWINLGAAHNLMEKPKKAKEFYLLALELAKKEKMVDKQAVLYNNLGLLTNDLAESDRYYREALELQQQDELFQAIVRSNLAANARDAKRYDEARTLALEAAAELEELGARQNEYKAQQVLIELAIQAKDEVSLERHLDRLIDLAEEIVTGLAPRSARTFVQSGEESFHDGLIFTLNQKKLERSFNDEERLRSLGLAALTRGVNLASAHLPPELEQRRRSLRTQIDGLKGRRLRSDERQSLNELQAQYRLVVDQIERHHLAAGALHSMHSATVEEVQSLLEDDEALLEYLEAGDRFHLLVVSRNSIKHYPLGPVEDTERAVLKTLRAINRRGKPETAISQLAELTELLMAPAREELAQYEELVIVPAGRLFALPFPALFDGDVPLFERYRMTTASSASAWMVSRRSQPQGQGALLGALGNLVPGWAEGKLGSGRAAVLSPLPATLVEVESLLNHMPKAIDLKEDSMTAAALERGAAGKKTLHFATHGVLDRSEPMFSGLVAADRLVTAADIFNWKLDAELAVLSACHSGESSRGEEYVSLTSAFQFAGARTLLVTMWAVSDDATASWMQTFYAEVDQGKSVAEALQQAHRAIRATHPHPYYWAPFTLWGEGEVRPI